MKIRQLTEEDIRNIENADTQDVMVKRALERYDVNKQLQIFLRLADKIYAGRITQYKVICDLTRPMIVDGVIHIPPKLELAVLELIRYVKENPQ